MSTRDSQDLTIVVGTGVAHVRESQDITLTVSSPTIGHVRDSQDIILIVSHSVPTSGEFDIVLFAVT